MKNLLRRSLRSPCLGLFLFVGGSANAIDLWQVFQLARQNNAAIHANQKTSQASLETYWSTLSNLFPQASASASMNKSRYTGSIQGTYHGDTYSVSASQVLFNPQLWMTVLSQYHSAESAVLAYQYQYQQFIQLIIQDYFAVLEAEDQVKVDVANIDNLKTAYEQALAQYKVGTLVETAVKQAEAKYKQAQATKIKDQNIVEVSKQKLQAVLGKPIESLSPLREPLNFHFPEPVSLQAWIQTGLAQNKSLKAAEQRLLSNQATFDSDVGACLPSISVVLSVTDLNPHLSGDTGVISSLFLSHTVNRQATLNFNWNIFGGPNGANRYSIEEGAAIYAAAQDTKLQTYRDTQTLVTQDFNNVKADLQNVQSYQAAVKENQSALLQSQARFGVGMSTMLDVLQSVEALYQAKTQYLKSEYQFINDQIQLKIDAGILTEKDVQDLNLQGVSTSKI